MTLDGVFDADTIDQWYTPFDSDDRQAYINAGIAEADTIIVGRTTYEMLAPFWSGQKNDDLGPASKRNSVPRYLVHPIIAGSGKRFFKDDMCTPALKLIKTKTLDAGVILLCYQPSKR